MQNFNAETTIATLRAFAAQHGIAVSKKANKEALIALVNAFVAEQANAEQAAQNAGVDASEENAAVTAFRFPKASDYEQTAVTVVRPAGWSHIEAGNEETAEEQEARVAAEQEAEYEQETAEEQEARLAAESAADTGTAGKTAEEKKRTLSDAIKETWTRPAVAKARLTRDTVIVTAEGSTEEFRSVWQAFEYYGLPAASHIRFRGKLKKSRAETFEHNGVKYAFEYDYADSK